MTEHPSDILTIRRVANGWIVAPGPGTNDAFIHVAVSPADLAERVTKWATAQLKPPVNPK